MFFAMRYLFLYNKTVIMRSEFICYFCQWVGEEIEGKDSDSGDCDCVIEC